MLMEFTCEVLWPWTFFIGRSLITVLWLVCLYFLYLPGSVLEGCTFLRICPFLLACPFHWHKFLAVVSYDPFYFCVVSYLLVHFKFYWFEPFFFFTCKRSKPLFSHFTNNAGLVGCFLWLVKKTESHILVRLLRLLLCFNLGWGCGGGSRGSSGGSSHGGSSHKGRWISQEGLDLEQGQSSRSKGSS